MTTTNFDLAIDGDGIALLTWNMPDRSMNVITIQGIEELSAIVERLTADAAVKGVVVTSAKEAFCGGADITMLESLGRTYAGFAKELGEEEAALRFFEESRKLSLVYRHIETCGKPWVAALNGTAMR
jgi:3-hydroxyacyl-CoA dehydrogenase/enoyl-CoA hydratase/3-hydroxybutyryl-CoA epimerase